MRNLARLRHLFRAAAMASVAACGGSSEGSSASAPGSTGGEPGTLTGEHIDRTGFQSLCTSGVAFDLLSGLTPAKPVDYLEQRVQFDPNTSFREPRQQTPRGHGNLCATATDPTKCKDAFVDLKATGWSNGGMVVTYTYLAYSRGDEVGVVDSRDAVMSFLAPVDTPHDALYVVQFSGHAPSCEYRNAANGGFDVVTTTGDGCGANNDKVEHIVNVAPNGEVKVLDSVVIKKGEPNCAHGRRPEGLVPHRTSQRGLAGFLCEMTHLEAASIPAFDRLARELEIHGAPRHLIDDARRAQRDEVRHAKMAAKLALRAGGIVEAPVVPELPVRDLFAIAVENAVEGCVAETFAALLAEVQWRRASDPSIARAMKIIAEDETRHAALAWDVAEWMEERLTVEERAQVAEARREAARALRASHAVDFDPDVRTFAGMPSAEETRALVDMVASELWAA